MTPKYKKIGEVAGYSVVECEQGFNLETASGYAFTRPVKLSTLLERLDQFIIQDSSIDDDE